MRNLKIGDVFLGELASGEWVPFTIVELDTNTIGYTVKESFHVIYRDFETWYSWVDEGEMFPCTELMKALL
jgi:hypothetical protein